MTPLKNITYKLNIDNDLNKLHRKIMIPVTKTLTLDEKKYLLSVERGDMANVRGMIQTAHKFKSLDINCVDNLGRGGITIAIDGENLEMLELLVVMGVETKDALLHAINVEFVEAVEFLLEHEEVIHKDGDSYSWQKVDANASYFTPDITPIILAAHRNNYEILKILLDRGATLPMPHDVKCGCDECIEKSKEDSLRHSLARVNLYRALASPSLIGLTSLDPILTAFQLSWEMRNLAFAEPEYKADYLELRMQCQQFAVDLLHQSRSSQELGVILNHDTKNLDDESEEPMKLARLELAIKYKQKKFVAHPNIQQLLAAIWYEGVPGFRRKSTMGKVFVIVKVALLFPLYCLLYMIYPNSNQGKLMRKPFMKFLIHASSYLFFLFIMILVSQRIELPTTSEKPIQERGNPPVFLEYIIILYVLGFILEGTQEICVQGFRDYLKNMWNFIDFTRNLLYCLVFIIRVVAYIQQLAEIKVNSNAATRRREDWSNFDPQLIAEGFFATANIFSALKLIHLFSINPHLGPLQISLRRMVIDIIKFFFIYMLVLFSFACGLHQLLSYFSNLEWEKCDNFRKAKKLSNATYWENDIDSCKKWRGFYNVFETSQSLFWASFGMTNIDNFELEKIQSYTRFWGLLIYGAYSVINITVLLNLLIAMMSNSYASIHEHSDTEWKFARSKLWMSYFEGSSTLPPPFNLLPTPKKIIQLCKCGKKSNKRNNSNNSENKDGREEDYRYTTVMRALVWRYVSAMHRKCEENIVTEDDISEVKSEVSAFRYELLDILNKNGMDMSGIEKKDKTILGKKMKVWERRLMKDFKVVPITSDADSIIYEPPTENETSLGRFRRVAKLALLNSNLNKWRLAVKGVRFTSQIGQTSGSDSYQKKQNIKKAMEAAKKLVTKNSNTSTVSPIKLPDTTGSKILDILDVEKKSNLDNERHSLLPKVIILNKTKFDISDRFEDKINEMNPSSNAVLLKKEYRVLIKSPKKLLSAQDSNYTPGSFSLEYSHLNKSEDSNPEKFKNTPDSSTKNLTDDKVNNQETNTSLISNNVIQEMNDSQTEDKRENWL